MCCLLLPLALLTAAEAGPRVLVLPNFGYTPDDGYGVGFYVEVGDRPGTRLRPRSLVVHTYLSSDGFQNQRLRLDLPELGRWHLYVGAAWRAWQHDAWFGAGPGALRALDAEPTFYSYSLEQPYGHVGVGVQVAPSLLVYATGGVEWTRVEADAGSLLALEQPYGMHGGLAFEAGGGALLDTRDDVLAPRRGVVVEAGGRVGIPLEADPFGGPYGWVRTWFGVGPVVVAGRVGVEHLFGDVPFYDTQVWGGFAPLQGIGGEATARGLAYGRWHTPGKAVGNLELRVEVGDAPLAGGTLRLQVAPFADALAGWGGGTLTPGAWPIHPAFGAGLRGVWSGGLVGRIDGAVGLDPVTDGATSRQAPTFGGYLAFSQMF